MSSSQTVFTPGASSSSGSASAIASSTQPGSAIAIANTSDNGNIFVPLPTTDQLFLLVNVTPEIPSELVEDIQSINQSFLAINVLPDVMFEWITVEFSDHINAPVKVEFNTSSSSLDSSASASSISVPVEYFNVSISPIQQESSQSAFTIYEVVGLSDPVVFDPLSLEVSLELGLEFAAID